MFSLLKLLPRCGRSPLWLQRSPITFKIRGFSSVPDLSLKIGQVHIQTPFHIDRLHRPQTQVKQVDGYPIYTIDQFLTPPECQTICQQAERIGFEPATVDRHTIRENQDSIDTQTTIMLTKIRNNLRLIFENSQLAQDLQQRLIACQFPALDRVPADHSPLLWTSVNSRMKIYHYAEDQYFRPHRDGIYVNIHTKEQSRFTFMIYLNDDYQDGGTQFHLNEGKYVITPQQGRAVIFYHNLKHEGLPITRGRKLVLRSDLMFLI